jgi:hypothetical protein
MITSPLPINHATCVLHQGDGIREELPGADQQDRVEWPIRQPQGRIGQLTLHQTVHIPGERALAHQQALIHADDLKLSVGQRPHIPPRSAAALPSAVIRLASSR